MSKLSSGRTITTSARHGLFGETDAVVIGLPHDFDLNRELQRARRIRIATAFAHQSGWTLIWPAIRKSKADISLLTSLAFCQTEPKILKKWLRLSETGRASARLYVAAQHLFHPKVILVDGASSGSFAIVGSGNLSAGGLRDNIECSLYVSAPRAVRELASWFQNIFPSALCNILTQADIDTYLPIYKKARRSAEKLRKGQRRAESLITHSNTKSRKRWSGAVSAAARYFASEGFRVDYRGWRKEVDDILRTLDYPRLNFDRAGWAAFFAIESLGLLDPRHRDVTFDQLERVKRALHHLIDEAVPITERINNIVDPKGRLHVRGVGWNLSTKILTAHEPKKWPTLNEPVRQVLQVFGYPTPEGTSSGEKYQVFARRMAQFMSESHAPDMIALDCFFWRERNSKLV